MARLISKLIMISAFSLNAFAARVGPCPAALTGMKIKVRDPLYDPVQTAVLLELKALAESPDAVAYVDANTGRTVPINFFRLRVISDLYRRRTKRPLVPNEIVEGAVTEDLRKALVDYFTLLAVS